MIDMSKMSNSMLKMNWEAACKRLRYVAQRMEENPISIDGENKTLNAINKYYFDALKNLFTDGVSFIKVSRSTSPSWNSYRVIISMLADEMESATIVDVMRANYKPIEEFLCETGFARSCEECGKLIFEGYNFYDEQNLCKYCAEKVADEQEYEWNHGNQNEYAEEVLKVFGRIEADEDEIDNSGIYYTDWEGEF